MLIILLIFALFRTLRGVPLASSLDNPNGSPDLVLRDASSHFGERAISDIILSCFATIFACTWSAVHPNVPAPTDCSWTHFKQQVLTMVYALLAPEAITAWALRQRLSARKIVKFYNRQPWVVRNRGLDTSKSNPILGNIRAIFHDSPLPPKLKAGQVPHWTLAHGFFLQMGGFMLSEGGQPTQVLTYSSPFDEVEIIWNIRNKIINPLPTTEEDIQDRSKDDAISKTLIILQTTWFIVQCITRWSNRLPVTELEVVTLGFAMLNGFTYALWWHKPQNVGRQVFLEIKHKRQESSNVLGKSTSATENTIPGPTTRPENLEARRPEYDRISNPSRELEAFNEDEVALIFTKPAPAKKSYLRRKLQEDTKEHASDPRTWKLLYLVPLRLIESLLRPLSKLADYYTTRQEVHTGALRMPMFYSEDADNSKVYTLTTLTGVLFGLVHLITSWFLDFASVNEMWLWRGSAIVITVGPVFMGLWDYSHPFYQRKSLPRTLHELFKACLVGILPLYIISRIVLLILALTSLCALSPPALQTIDWITFIPHI